MPARMVILNQSIIKGGFGTRDEMCSAFLVYYPKMIPSKPCMSALTAKTIKTLADISEDSPQDVGQSLTEYVSEKQNWNQTVLNSSHQIMLTSRQTLQCYWIKADEDQDIEEWIGYPELTQTYSPPQMQCGIADKVEGHFFSVATILTIAIFLVIAIALTLVWVRRRDLKYENRLI